MFFRHFPLYIFYVFIIESQLFGFFFVLAVELLPPLPTWAAGVSCNALPIAVGKFYIQLKKSQVR